MSDLKKVRVCAKTDIGIKREKNEDNYLIIDDQNKTHDISHLGRMYALADGMGGHAGGEVASKMACEGMIGYYSRPKNDLNGSEYFKARLQNLKSTLYEAHNNIVDYGQINSEYDDMGTTLSVMILFENRVLIGHLGDSRIYRLRKEVLEQLTEDHTFAQIFLQKGYITPKVASEHPMRHVLTQALGKGVEDIFLKIEIVKQGDTYLLCSDGLHDMISDVEIKKNLSENYALNQKCDRLVQRALDMGGKDNVTVMVIEVQ